MSNTIERLGKGDQYNNGDGFGCNWYGKGDGRGNGDGYGGGYCNGNGTGSGLGSNGIFMDIHREGRGDGNNYCSGYALLVCTDALWLICQERTLKQKED